MFFVFFLSLKDKVHAAYGLKLSPAGVRICIKEITEGKSVKSSGLSPKAVYECAVNVRNKQ